MAAELQRNAESVTTVAAEYYDIKDLTPAEVDRLMRSSPEVMHGYLKQRPNARLMTLPPNSMYPGYEELHLEEGWCKVAGCKPAL